MKTSLPGPAQPSPKKGRAFDCAAPAFMALLIVALLGAAIGAQADTALAVGQQDQHLPGLAQSEWGPAAPAGVRDYAALGSRSGWLLVANRLYRTEDGGSSWADITPPGALELAAVHFLDAQQGWVMLNPGLPGEMGSLSLELATTQDGGATWQVSPVVLQGDESPVPPVAYFLEFVDPQAGWLVAKQATSSNFSAGSLYRTLDGGLTWELLETPLGEAVHFLDRLVGYIYRAETGEAYQTLDGGLTWNALQASVVNQALGLEEGRLPPQAVQGKFLDEKTGWALAAQGACESRLDLGGRACNQAQSLLATGDGGQTWREMSLPVSLSTSIPAPLEQAIEPSAPVPLASGHGIDKCEVPSLAQLQEWWNASPYEAVNLYIDGAARACSNKALNASYVAQIDRQGWTLIPTWVGPQAACSGYKIKMSYDPDTARQQGYDEAIAAIQVAKGLGLWGQVIYYDLEAFNTSDSACLAAARKFIDGWTYGLHGNGYVAGVYGSPCSSGLKDFYTLPDKPEAVWIAHWIYTGYNPDATVWNVACMDDTYWPDHQRIRQYAGGHTETWGTVSMTIDSNVMDGVVAQAYGQPDQVCPRVSPPAIGGVIFYNSPDYSCAGRQANYGYVWQAKSGLYNLNSFFSDRASSIYIPLNWSVRVYDGTGGTGGKACLEAPGDANFSDNTFDNGQSINDSISSYQVYTTPGCGATLAPEMGGLEQASAATNAAARATLNPYPAPTSNSVEMPTVDAYPPGEDALAAPLADTQPPSLSITSHATRSYLNAAQAATPINVQASIQDSDSGVSHAQFFGGFDDGSGWKWYLLGWDHNGTDGWLMNWDLSMVPDQSAVGLYAAAWDVQGNVAGYSVRHITLDRLFPSSALQALSPSLDSSIVRLSWTSSDPAAPDGSASGLARFDLQVQVDGGGWQDWQTGLPPTQTSAIYYAQLGHSYGFRMRTADQAGNQEAYPGSAETTTTTNLCVGDSFEPDNSSAAAKTLGLNTPQNHTICGLGDQDWLAFTPQAGQFYQFYTRNLAGDSDTFLALYAADGSTLLAENDDVQPGLQSSILWQAPSNNKVYLRVTHTDSRVGGNAVTYQVGVETPVQTWLPLLRR